jgi:hypothetical protein
MDLKEQAKKRRTTKNPDNWRKIVTVSLHADDIARAARLMKHHGMKRSELIRYLMLKEEQEING